MEVAESQPKFLKRNVVDCVNGMIQIAGNTDLEDATRHLALEFLLTVAEQTPTTARKMQGFCASVVPVAVAPATSSRCRLSAYTNARQPPSPPPLPPPPVSRTSTLRAQNFMGRHPPSGATSQRARRTKAAVGPP